MIIGVGSLMGWIRNWMGVEGMSYLMYDTPNIYEDMVSTIAELSCWLIDRVLPTLPVKPDLAIGWEEMCGRSGPLIHPDMFDLYVRRHYLRVRDALERNGVYLYGIDTDGDIRDLVGHWLDAGVNLQMPVEIGVWNCDPALLRREYGDELRIVGGFDKRCLEQGREAIRRELDRRVNLIEDGGYIPMPDHYIPPGTPLDAFRYYLDLVRSLEF